MEEKQSGLSGTFRIKCSFCGNLNEAKYSAEHRAVGRGPLVNDINTRAVLGSLHAGMGNTHLNNLLSRMYQQRILTCLKEEKEKLEML